MGDVAKLPRCRLSMRAEGSDLLSLSVKLASRYALGTTCREENVQGELETGLAVLALGRIVFCCQAPTSGAASGSLAAITGPVGRSGAELPRVENLTPKVMGPPRTAEPGTKFRNQWVPQNA
ncbi:hypothetical protein NDU88_000797 [Pleurodeles waltl]|uniref:Uncharacterized protein n=1 Tax=Pleurodeles waltl TaxID=8319 RepID=A0AAV7SAJ5_PLEWA|nr:hypothetical protein NDU88_000797 [Pleurodeles waltl]